MEHTLTELIRPVKVYQNLLNCRCGGEAKIAYAYNWHDLEEISVRCECTKCEEHTHYWIYRTDQKPEDILEDKYLVILEAIENWNKSVTAPIEIDWDDD